MNNPKPSVEIRRRLMLTIHQDGLLDILAGLVIATFGLVPLLDESGMNKGIRSLLLLFLYMLEVGGIMWLKRAITWPRTGVVQLARKTTSRMAVTMLVINVLLFVFFAGSSLLRLPVAEALGPYSLSITLGLLFLILLTSSGVVLRAPRFHLYALCVLGMYILSEHLFLRGITGNHGIPLASFLSGGVTAGSGGILLIRFLRKYRVVKE